MIIDNGNELFNVLEENKKMEGVIFLNKENKLQYESKLHGFDGWSLLEIANWLGGGEDEISEADCDALKEVITKENS